MKKEKFTKITKIVVPFVVLVLLIAVMSVQRYNHLQNTAALLEQLSAANETVLQMSHEFEILQVEMAELQETQENLPFAEEEWDSRFLQQAVYENAAAILSEIVDTEVLITADFEDFVVMPNRNLIWLFGEWESDVLGEVTIEAFFRFWGAEMGVIAIELVMYSPFGWGAGWRTHLPNWQDLGSWRRSREHALQSVPVRFYWVDWGGSEEMLHVTEYLDGENFSEELIRYAEMHLNRRITDAWFTDNGRILYVNLHFIEPMRMSSGTSGEMSMYHSLLQSLASVPNVELLVIMVDGMREPEFGGHGANFRDIYFTDEIDFVDWWGW